MLLGLVITVLKVLSLYIKKLSEFYFAIYGGKLSENVVNSTYSSFGLYILN